MEVNSKDEISSTTVVAAETGTTTVATTGAGTTTVSAAEAAAKAEAEAAAAKKAREEAAAAVIANRLKFFNQNFRSLYKILTKIIKARKSDLIELNKAIVELDCLNKYFTIYEKTQPDDHYEYFSNVYNRYRDEILLGSDTWITSSKKQINIQFGEGIKSLEGKVNNAKIMITSIYNMALELKQNSDDSLKGTNIENESEEAFFPIIIRYHLYCIFFYLLEPNDKDVKTLGLIINNFEKSLNMDTRTYIEPTNNNSNTGISAIFNMAKGVMSKMGVEVGNVPAPNEADIMTVFNNVLNNEKTQTMMQGIFSSLKNGNQNDIGGTLNGIVQSISKPESMEILRETVASTSKELHKNNGVQE
jgi:hypothetical protein